MTVTLEAGYPMPANVGARKGPRAMLFDAAGDLKSGQAGFALSAREDLGTRRRRFRVWGFYGIPTAADCGIEVGDRIAIWTRQGRAVTVEAADRITLEDITLYAAGFCGFVGHVGQGPITFRRCRVLRRPGAPASGARRPILAAWWCGATRSVRPATETPAGAGAAIAVYTDGDKEHGDLVSDILVEGNTIIRPAGSAISLDGCRNVTIRHNTIRGHGTFPYNPYPGQPTQWPGYGTPVLDVSSQGTVIEGNRVVEPGPHARRWGASRGGLPSAR